jgi:hypothetical protein
MRLLCRSGRTAGVVAAGLALAVAMPTSVAAHVKTNSGPFTLTIGWGHEPAYSGSENFVEVGVTDRAGRPAGAIDGMLAVQVAFGDARVTLPLVPDARTPGRFRAILVPTRPGTYAFHVTGTLNGHTIDAATTCSDRTFACVSDIADVQFPIKDPSNGALAQKLARGPSGRSDDGGATTLAIVAIVVAVLALAAALVPAARRRWTGV